ncbi:hypothetical protein BC941DRAFT_451379 [Chlamydoabsidia padenii]|nr:hypothetical protein BC941DRAFT_451379 [Chlamydoabsidia padenii]
MQLSLKAILLLGTLAGLAMASKKGGHYHHKGGVIKRTILIDGCTGQPIERHPYPPPEPYSIVDVTEPPQAITENFESGFENADDFDFFNGNEFDDGTYGDDGANLVYRDGPSF